MCSQDDPGRLQPRRLGQVEMGVVDAKKSAALAIAKPDPRADPFGPEESTLGWNGGRLFQPERAAVKLLETPRSKKTAQYSPAERPSSRPTPIWPCADEQIRQFGDLFVQGLLYAKDVGCGLAQYTSPKRTFLTGQPK